MGTWADFFLVSLFTSYAAGDCAMGSPLVRLGNTISLSLSLGKSTFVYEKCLYL